MSKSTKVIAALGVVAGLGVAALPMASFATQSATGDAEVIVKVDPAIALEIAGNNDDNHIPSRVSGETFGSVVDITPNNTGLVDGSGNDLTETNIKTSSSAVTMTQYSVVEGDAATAYDATTAPNGGFFSTLKVTTNDAGGYSLAVAAKTAADVDLTNAAGDTIPSIAAAGTLTAGTAAWGIQPAAAYAGSTMDSTITNWNPVTTAGYTVKVAPAQRTGYTQDTSIVEYGVATGKAQPTGQYQATLTYTATTAN